MRKALTRRLFVAGVAALGLATGFALGASSAIAASEGHKLSPDLVKRIHAGGNGSARVIIQYADAAAAGDEEQVRSHGGSPGKHLPLVRGLAAEVPLAALSDLAADPRIRRISVDSVVRPSLDTAGPSSGVEDWQPAPELTGTGVGVAVIDSGVAPHPDLPSLIGFVDFLQPNAPDTDDPFGHGTHVAGIIGGRRIPAPDGSGLFFGGIAPGASLISLRVLDRWGRGQASDVIEAIGWAIAHKNQYNIRILNLSLGHTVEEPFAFDPLDEACEEAWRAGLLVVASAGNRGLDGNGTITSPGNDPRILTVGALDDHATLDWSDDDAAMFSSQGPTFFDLVVKPDLLAPGFRIVSLRSPHSSLDVSHPEARISLGDGPSGKAREPLYFEMSGSSMAAALVSGLGALMIEADPTLTPDTIKARLMGTARRLDDETIFQRGAGAADLDSALADSGLAEAAVSPSLYLDGDGNVAVQDLSAWGDPGAWSLEAIYGEPTSWQVDSIVLNGYLDDPCVTNAGLVWQGRSATASTTGEGLVWQGLTAMDDVSGSGLVWQGRSATGSTTGQGLVWQGLTGMTTCTSAAGLVWQGARVSQEGLVWQGGDVSSEGLVWQGRK